jgi:hypothetical protein
LFAKSIAGKEGERNSHRFLPVLGGSLNSKRTVGSSSLNISDSMVSIISKT